MEVDAWGLIYEIIALLHHSRMFLMIGGFMPVVSLSRSKCDADGEMQRSRRFAIITRHVVAILEAHGADGEIRADADAYGDVKGREPKRCGIVAEGANVCECQDRKSVV